MKIWKSESPEDENIYCFYGDINRLSGNILPCEEVLHEQDSLLFPFGVGFSNNVYKRYLCQADALVWVFYECLFNSFPDPHSKREESRREIISSLKRSGLPHISIIRRMVEDAKCKL